ncbi:MAG: AMP-dependent synthetase/ligase [Bryobacteraceae bacterium]
MPGRNIFTTLEETAAQHGDAVALYQPAGAKAKGEYRTYSWNEWLAASREIALGLRALGLAKGDIVCILSETRAEFYLTDLGIMGAGGIAAALYTAYPMADLAKNLSDVAPKFLFLEDAKMLGELSRAVEDSGGSMPEHLVLLTGEAGGALSLAELLRLGREAMERDPQAFSRIQEEISPEEPAILYLTSGATGEPKMSLTSHRAALANMDMSPVALPVAPEDSTVVFLPSAHIAQRIVLELIPMRMGMPVWFSESLSRLPGELRSIRPTVFLAPPRLWERMYATIQNELNKRPAIARKLFYLALGLGSEAFHRRLDKRPVPAWMSQALKLADKLMFAKIRERLGGRVRIAASGAAPLGKDLAEFFAAIGMPLIEGYGLTEAGVLCFNPLDRPKPGSIGTALPGVDMRLAEDGELQVRTPCLLMGYYKDEAATRSVVGEDGWFSTGDIAETDSEGYWYITGRKKEVIVSSNGKKIYPARIESLFLTEPVIHQIVLIGDKKPYVTALLTVSESENAEQNVKQAVARVNRHLADFERIRRFKIIDRDFSIEYGELTPTMKIRRARVLENHKALVSELYLGRDGAE